MELVRTIKQTFRVNWGEMVTYALITAAGGILGIAIMLVMLAFDGMEGMYLKMGTIMALVCAVIMLLFSGIFSLKNDFNLAVSMGKTRKYFVPAKYLVFVADCLVCGVIPMLISGVEDVVYGAVYPKAVCGFDVGVLFESPVYWICILLVAPVGITLLGGLFLKFANKFFYVFWALWMMICLGGPRVLSASVHNPDSMPGKTGAVLLQFFGQGNKTAAVIALSVFLIGSVIAIVLIFRRQRVTQ